MIRVAALGARGDRDCGGKGSFVGLLVGDRERAVRGAGFSDHFLGLGEMWAVHL